MLIGSDMPIFGDQDHPSVSLRLHNAEKPINILTGLDYWLDNMMCQVPEVMMCYHLDGIVQRYEIIKTEDLPKISDEGKFSPRVVQDVAKNILSFLQSNAAKEGHTYWLFKGKDDDVVKLYDLTSLCNEATPSNSPNEKPAQEQSQGIKEGECQSPFRTAVSMLLYKAARNMLQSNEQRANEGRTVKKALMKCLSLLDQAKFPHIATSAHFMLSDLYVPDDVNPASFGREESAYKSTDSSHSHTETNEEVDLDDPGEVKEINLSMLKLPPEEGRSSSPNQSLPAPLLMDSRQRCISALEHVIKGLELLGRLEKRNELIEAEENKQREREERENQRMARPGEPIPMPYIKPDLSKSQIDVFRGPVDKRLAVLAESRKWHDFWFS